MKLLTLFRLPFFAAVLIALAAMVASAWVLGIAAFIVAAALFVLGRDPDRHVPSRPLGVVSPVDGHAIDTGEVEDPFLERKAVVVRLRQGILSPAVLHSPVQGRVEQIWCGASIPDGAEGSVVGIHIRTDERDDVVFALGPACLPGPLRWTVQPGERVGQGLRRGLAGWGRRVVLYLPVGTRPTVESGAVVHAGADVVGRFPSRD